MTCCQLVAACNWLTATLLESTRPSIAGFKTSCMVGMSAFPVMHLQVRQLVTDAWQPSVQAVLQQLVLKQHHLILKETQYLCKTNSTHRPPWK